MVLHTQPAEPWEDFDFKLIEAYQMLVDETCKVCGQPTWLCRSEDPDLIFEVRSSVCLADKAMKKKEQARQERNEKKNGNGKVKANQADFGKHWFALPTMIPESGRTDLPTRQDFYKQMSDNE